MSEIVLKPGKKKPNILGAEEPKLVSKPQAGGVERVDHWLEKLLDSDSRIRPGFADAWVSLTPMDEKSKLARYHVGTARIDICSVRGGAETLYRITPREYTLPDAGIKLLHKAKQEFVENVRGGGTSNTSKLKSQLRREASETINSLARSTGMNSGQMEEVGGIEFLTDALLGILLALEFWNICS